MTLRTALGMEDPAALSTAYVARGIFYSRPGEQGEGNVMIAMKPKFEATGGKFVEQTGMNADHAGRLADRADSASLSGTQLERFWPGAHPARVG